MMKAYSSLRVHQRTQNCRKDISPVSSNLSIVGAGTPLCSANDLLDFFRVFLLSKRNSLMHLEGPKVYTKQKNQSP